MQAAHVQEAWHLGRDEDLLPEEARHTETQAEAEHGLPRTARPVS